MDKSVCFSHNVRYPFPAFFLRKIIGRRAKDPHRRWVASPANKCAATRALNNEALRNSPKEKSDIS